MCARALRTQPANCALAYWLLLMALLLQPLSAQAQTAASVGTGRDALPGVHEVPLAVQPALPVVGRAGFSYGWTEAVLKQNDSHHRLQLDASGGFSPLSWLSTSLRLLGRYDLHTGEGSGTDYGVVTETHLAARATFPLSADFHAGAELSLWLPGGESIAKALSAVSGDLQLLATYAPQQTPLTVGLSLGLRADRSRYAGGQPDQYSAADRLALGVSDAVWAARQGIALTYRTGPMEWVAEWAFRMYFAHIAESPMWLRAGTRFRPNERLQLELLAGFSPSKRPSLDDGAPLAVVEPRLWFGLAASYAWPVGSDPQPTAAEETPQATNEPAPQPERRAQLAGQALAPGGAGLASAHVTLRCGADTQERSSDAQGRFDFAELTPGPCELIVSAQGFKPDRQTVTLQAGEARELTIPLVRELPIGQIRGTVRRFDGTPVKVQVTVSEIDKAQQSREDGTFEIDVPPGDYTVKVTAAGFLPQSRSAHVELRGVAILIIELEPTR